MLIADYPPSLAFSAGPFSNLPNLSAVLFRINNFSSGKPPQGATNLSVSISHAICVDPLVSAPDINSEDGSEGDLSII